jgi:hypothetical protein
VPALEAMPGLRVVAEPAALDVARWTAVGVSDGSEAVGHDADRIVVLRIAPDEAFALGATHVEIGDPDAIVEDERGYVGAWCTIAEIAPHLEWSLSEERPAVAQGSVAGVPARVWLPTAVGLRRDSRERAGADHHDVLLVTAAAYADVLAERLGWPR